MHFFQGVDLFSFFNFQHVMLKQKPNCKMEIY